MNQTPPQSKFNSAYVFYDRACRPDAANREEAEGLCRLVPMRPGERLLDAGCGYARHLVQFARLGLQSTGIDRSRAMFREALRCLEEAQVRAQLECMPIQAMPFRRHFHHVVMLNNSFGYGRTAEEDVEVLAAIHAALIPRAHFVLELSNPDHGEPWRESRRVFRLPEMVVEEERTYLPRHDLWQVRQKVQRGSWTGEWQMVLRRYDRAAVESLLAGCGFEIAARWSDFAGSLFLGGEERMIFCCRAQPAA